MRSVVTTPPPIDTLTPPPIGGLAPLALGATQPAARNARVTGVQVLATGSYAPPNATTNDALQASLGVDGDWILRRTGIRERRHAPAEMTTSDLCHEAAARCIAAAGVNRADIDLVIVATVTPDMTTPSTASLLQDRLGLRCGAFDIQTACSGFVYALATAAQYVQTGAARRCLVVGGDVGSRLIDPTDRETYPLFGDGAGAVLLGPCGPGRGLTAYQLGSDGSGAKWLYRPAWGGRAPRDAPPVAAEYPYMRMDGRAVFRWAVRTVAESTGQLLQYAGVAAADIDLFVPHQANLRIVQALAEHLGLAPDRVYTNLDRYGNTIAASLPLALDEAVAGGRVRSGDQLLLTGFGAGLAWGSVLLRW